jgi:hypothetical protein
LPRSAAQRLSKDVTGSEQRALRVGLPKSAAQRLSKAGPKQRALRVGLPRSAAQRLGKDVTGSEQRALRVGLPKSAAQRLSKDLPKSAFLHSRTINERRATDAAFRSDQATKEQEISRANARPKRGLAGSPDKVTTRTSLDFNRVGKPDIEAESEDEVTDEKGERWVGQDRRTKELKESEQGRCNRPQTTE